MKSKTMKRISSYTYSHTLSPCVCRYSSSVLDHSIFNVSQCDSLFDLPKEIVKKWDQTVVVLITKEELMSQLITQSDLDEMLMEETRDVVAQPFEGIPPSPTLGASEVAEILGSSTSGPSEVAEILGSEGETSNTVKDGYRASDILWSTGSFSDSIPDGFYSVIPDNRLKPFKSIPTFDELRALPDKDIKSNVILINFPEDKNLIRYTNLITTLVDIHNSKPDAAIKKIVQMVSNVYLEKSRKGPRKRTPSPDFPLLGHIQHGSCRARALLFKVLADAVGFESRIVVGVPSDLQSSASDDSYYHHMSVVVLLDNVEMLVDLVRCPGFLVPLSSNGIRKVHYSRKYSCVSPLKPGSPMYSISRSEPNIAAEILRRSQGNATEHTTSSSGSTEINITRRSDSTTLKISGDVVRPARRMRKPLKPTRFVQDQLAEKLSPDSPNDRIGSPGLQSNVSSLPLDSQSHVTGGRSELEQDPPKAMSLPTYPRIINQIWDETWESPMFQNKPLLPYEGWNIDFTELRIESRVGIGCFGVVYRGTWKGTDIAVKMPLGTNPTIEEMEDFYNEISILSRLRHPNACTKPPQLSVVTELVERGSLYSAIHTNQYTAKLTSWRTKIKIMRHICRGLMYIHGMGIVHRDLKSSNCLLTKSWKAKICDFGLSITMKDTATKGIVSAGTPQWMAPELIRKEPFSEKCDIFSFGVIMWEICTLSRPWQGVPNETVIRTVAYEGARLEIPEGPIKNLITDCWSEPEQRPSCEDILSRLSLFDD